MWMQLKLRLFKPGSIFPIVRCPVLAGLKCPVLSWKKWHPVWSSAAVPHLLKDLLCCAFRGSILYGLILTNFFVCFFVIDCRALEGKKYKNDRTQTLSLIIIFFWLSSYECFSSCCFSILSNQSSHSLLNSDINKTFLSTQLPFTGYFLFFKPFSINQRESCVWKFLKFLKYSDQPVRHQQPCHNQSHLCKSPPFLLSPTSFQPQQFMFTTCEKLHACMHWISTRDWLIVYLLSNWNK